MRYGLVTFGVLIAVVAQIASATAASARQIVLVVGTAQYDKIGSLKNPKRDAATIADRFRDLGFEVMEAFDADGFTLKRSTERFLAEARNADLAVFYFAGHGIQLFDRNVLIARDADPATARKLDDLGLDLTAFIATLRAAGPTRIAIFIDACGDNPFGFEETVALMRRLNVSAGDKDAARSTTRAPPLRGLATVALPSLRQRGRGAGEALILFAAQPGQVSFDGDGLNSYFVEGLREALAHPDRGLANVLRSASSYVRTATNGQQVPQLVSDWTSDVILGGTQAVKARYINASANSGRPLTDVETEVVGNANRAFEALNGTFIVYASQVFSGRLYPASEAERVRAKTLGMVNGFAIGYDLDRDGHADTIAAYVRQVPVIIEIVDKGISYTGTPCLGDQTTDGEEVESVEIALRDINGDRRPEIFVHFRSKSNPWGTLCILEYVGSSRLAEHRRGPSADYRTTDGLFRTLLRYEGAQSIRIGEDNTIESCSGSNCHTRTVFSFDGTYFKMLLNESDPPTPQEATPFRDQAERDRILPKAAASPPRGGPALHGLPPGTNTALQKFIAAYLADSSDTTIIGAQYADRVSYFGKPRTRAQIVVDKIKYQATWSRRSYTLLPETLSIAPSNDANGPIQVAFEYRFEVSNPTRHIQGRGRTSLTLLGRNGRHVITQESGEVTERY